MVPVLRGVDLDVQQGELLVILGSSGSGKSTLLHLLGGLDRPDRPGIANNDTASSITVDGTQLVGLSASGLDKHRSQTVGFVFQFYHLLPELTVLQNVLLAAMVEKGINYVGDKEKTLERAYSLLRLVGLDHRTEHKPVELSGGERQRVAIARALINQPPLLLADEPTGNLDSATGAKVLDTLLDLRKDNRQTMVIVTHDAATAARADRVVRLVDGRIARDLDSAGHLPSATKVSMSQPSPRLFPVDALPAPASAALAQVTQASPASQSLSQHNPTQAVSPQAASTGITPGAQPVTTTDTQSLAPHITPPMVLAPPDAIPPAIQLPLSASRGPEEILAAVRRALQQ